MQIKAPALLALGCVAALLIGVFRNRESHPGTAASHPAAAPVPANRRTTALPAVVHEEHSATAVSRRSEADPEKIRAEIEEATVQYSDSELPKFEHWLKSPDAEIRAAAVDGLIQSGLPGGAILLRDAAAASKNPQEIANLTEAANLLEAPPATARLVKAVRDAPKP